MQNKKILIVTSSYDKTCSYLIKKFSQLTFFRLDLDRFSDYHITFSANGFKIKDSNHYIDSGSCASIYFRKPSMEKLDGVFESHYHSYIHKETYVFVEGIVESFSGTVLTKPSVMRRANNKVLQASLAAQTGFHLPDFAITNDVSLLKHFSDCTGIIKPVAIGEITSRSSKEFVQTNLIDPAFETNNFEFSPVYLQNFIEKDFEVRVTVVDGQFFPVKIRSENNIDWRKPHNKVSYEACSIPSTIRSNCLTFMKLCNMKFGCFDFIVKGDVWYFLEMNANGQWAWLEFETGLNISGAIVGYLTKNRTQEEP
ncbi:MvdC/MvdD family ATP grasp protein [Vibrio metschnikovii]|uniref:MvdC/MvdD family ATP grasp protein n=1 Tax=Vibrio metschnikovii TaxID=28172 RepID=UPI0039F186D2